MRSALAPLRIGLAVLLAAALVTLPARASDPAPTSTARTDATFVGLSLVGSGAVAIGTLGYLGRGGSYGAALVAVPVLGLIQYGLGKLLGVRVTIGSVTCGLVLGLATGAAGFALGKLAGSEMQVDKLSLAAVGLVVGTAVGTPVWTLGDPLQLADPPTPTTGPAHAASDVSLSGSPFARARGERMVVLPLWGGRF